MKSKLLLPGQILFTGLLLSTILLPPARAETLDCTAITTLPYTITAQGIYCLTGNLSTGMIAGNAITINTNNVTLDLNGYKLGGLGGGDSTETNGIYAYQKKNITIKNGIVRGFYQGIFLLDDFPYSNSSGHVITSILADQNTQGGIHVDGLGNTISHNIVVDTGGSTVSDIALGITVRGSGAKVVNNTVATTTAQNTAYADGITLTNSDYSLIQNNTVSDTISDAGQSAAIYMASSTGVFLRNNNLASADYGLNFSLSSTGKYFNNLTFDVSTLFSGGTAIGSNNN